MGKVAKAWTVLTVGGVAWIGDVTSSASGAITAREWKELLIVGIAVVSVWLVPNAETSTV